GVAVGSATGTVAQTQGKERFHKPESQATYVPCASLACACGSCANRAAVAAESFSLGRKSQETVHPRLQSPGRGGIAERLPILPPLPGLDSLAVCVLGFHPRLL